MFYRSTATFVFLILTFVTLTMTTAARTTKIVVQVDNRPNYIEWLDAVVEKFHEEHPEIEVEVMVPTGDTLEALLVRVAGGTAPDIALHDPYNVIDLARQGVLVDLSPLIDRDADHFSDWFPPAFEMATYDGGLYGLPRDLQLWGMFYNEDAFQSSGLAYPDEGWTYEEFGEKARRLFLSDEQGNAVRHGSQIPWWRNWVIPIWAYGGDFVDSWVEPTRFVGHSEETVRGLQYLRNLVETLAIPDESTAKRWGGSNSFSQQRVAMYMQNSIAIQSFRDIDDFSWNVAPMPVGPAGRVTAINALTWFILNDSDHQDEAWTLLKYMTGPQALSMLVEITGVIPPRRDIALNEWITNADIPAPINRQYFLMESERARPIGALAGSVYTPLLEEGHAFIWGNKPLTAALETMEQRVNVSISHLQK